MFWVVTAGGASTTAPTRAEIVAGTGAGGSTALDAGVADANVASANVASNYFVASASASFGDVSTLPSDGFSVHVALAAPAPVNASVFSGDGAANPADVDASSGRRAAPSLARDEDEPDETIGFATLEETTFTPRVAVTSAPATVAYAVLRRGSRAPTPAQILAGLDANGRAPLDPAGSDFANTESASAAAAANVTNAFVGTAIGTGVENLTRGTWYDVHAVVADVGATNAPASFFRRVRARDDTEPFFLPGFPRATATSPTATRVEARLDEPAAVWAVVVPAGTLAAPPSVADVAAVAANRWNASTGTVPIVAEANATASSEGLSAVVVAVAVAVADERLGVGDDSRVRPVQLILSGLHPDTKYEVYAAARKYHRGVNGDAPATNGAAQSAAARIAATTPASVARLSALVASVGTFVPGFDPETTEYALKIPDPPGVAMPWPTAALAAVAGDARWFVEADGAPLAPGETTRAYAPGDVVSLRVAPRESHVVGRRFADGTDDVSRARVARHVGGGDARGGRDARAAARRDGRRRVVKRHANGRRRVARMYPRVRPGGHRRVPFGAKAMRDGPRSTRVSIDRLDRRDDRDGDGGDARAKRHGEVHRRRRRRRRGARHARGGGEDGDASGCRRCRPEGGEC